MEFRTAAVGRAGRPGHDRIAAIALGLGAIRTFMVIGAVMAFRGEAEPGGRDPAGALPESPERLWQRPLPPVRSPSPVATLAPTLAPAQRFVIPHGTSDGPAQPPLPQGRARALGLRPM